MTRRGGAGGRRRCGFDGLAAARGAGRGPRTPIGGEVGPIGGPRRGGRVRCLVVRVAWRSRPAPPDGSPALRGGRSAAGGGRHSARLSRATSRSRGPNGRSGLTAASLLSSAARAVRGTASSARSATLGYKWVLLGHKRVAIPLAVLIAAGIVYLAASTEMGTHPAPVAEVPPGRPSPQALVPDASPSPAPTGRRTARAAGAQSPRSAPASAVPAATSPLRPSTLAQAPAPPVRAASASSDQVSFEDGSTDNWVRFWGHITATVTSQVAYTGSHSLLLTTQGSTYSAVGVDDGTLPQPGQQVVFHVWSSGQAGDVQAFVQDDGFNAHLAGAVYPLPSKSGWFTVSWTVPSVSVHAIGLQVVNPGGGQLTLAIDALSWPGA